MEKILINKQSETLLVPLYCRAKESSKTDPVVSDYKAEEILKQVDYEFDSLKIPMGTYITVCQRAAQFDRYSINFLKQNPKGSIIYLGCGLDSRCERISGKVDLQKSQWYELDLPDAMELRKKFFNEGSNRHFIAASATDLRWLDNVKNKRGPFLVIAEGLFMYLPEKDIKALVLALGAAFRDCRLIFDCFSAFTVKKINRHPSIKKIEAVFHWGTDDARVLERWAPGIKLDEEWCFTQSEDVSKLSTGYRLIFKLVGSMKIARTAHRILSYKLSP